MRFLLISYLENDDLDVVIARFCPSLGQEFGKGKD
jgi:hypothetical protein